MMKNKICIISCYIGSLPDYFKVFLKSCNYNKSFNWIIVTDDETAYNIPQNVKILNMGIKDIQILIRDKIGEWAVLDRPYKLCDYKVAYGLIFEDYLEGYTHWGYGDIDVVYGDLEHLVTDEMLEKYDKIFPLGHLSIMKNNDECKRAFQLDVEGTLDYKEVFQDGLNSYYFDENNGINEKIVYSGKRVHTSINFIDISPIYSRMLSVSANETRITLPGSILAYEQYPKNYKNQIYLWNDGHINRVFYNKKKITVEEYSYMHFRRNLPVFCDMDSSCMVIGRDGIKTVESIDYLKLIKDNNYGSKYDDIEYVEFLFKRYFPRVKYFVVSSLKGMLYKSKQIRSLVKRIKNKI